MTLLSLATHWMVEGPSCFRESPSQVLPPGERSPLLKLPSPAVSLTEEAVDDQMRISKAERREIRLKNCRARLATILEIASRETDPDALDHIVNMVALGLVSAHAGHPNGLGLNHELLDVIHMNAELDRSVL